VLTGHESMITDDSFDDREHGPS